jgi:N6-adenosine-specific RNA methylase IME4
MLPLPTLSAVPIPPTGFSLLLLDPPWPNRSARRSNAYTITPTVSAALKLLRSLNLDMYVSPIGPVTMALWITNRGRIRDAARTFVHEMGLRVVEEWVWVKVTAEGEPVGAVDGEWRKPYEVLLVAKSVNEDGSEAVEGELKRRVIVAVPDEHSRKPCLKDLFELLLDLPRPYEALEVFARNLTAAWHAWGNEVLLFNWRGYWRDNET